jgi:hypothetical protein
MIYARRLRYYLQHGKMPDKALLSKDLWARWVSFLRDERKTGPQVFADMAVVCGPYLKPRTVVVDRAAS